MILFFPNLPKIYRMKNAFVLTFFFLLLGRAIAAQIPEKPLLQGAELEIWQVAPHVYRHVSFLQTNDFGKVACNGLLVVDGTEALVFDTPTNNAASEQLLAWISGTLHCKVKAVVPTHFHNDCLGGLAAFHAQGIASYANEKTILLAKAQGEEVPQKAFEQVLELPVGQQKVWVRFLGEGHTRDNVVAYFPSEEVLFGGCLIKELQASKGFLGDANVLAWPQTVSKVKSTFPKLQVVVPGHGKPGGIALLDYTMQLFTP